MIQMFLKKDVFKFPNKENSKISVLDQYFTGFIFHVQGSDCYKSLVEFQ